MKIFQVCKAFNNKGRMLPRGVWDACLAKLQIVEKDMGRKLGDPKKPLLVSVRSGAGKIPCVLTEP
jgi:pyruvate,orthophosphate dikinase